MNEPTLKELPVRETESTIPTLPGDEFKSAELEAVLTNEQRIEIHRRRQEELARQGRLAGCD